MAMARSGAPISRRDAMGSIRRDGDCWRFSGPRIAVSILIKGPLILMVVGLAALTLSAFDRSARWLLTLRPLPGVIWILLIVLPWFIAIYMRVGREFLVASVGEDMLAKVANSQEAHGAPPGLYLVLFFATFFPGCDPGGTCRARGLAARARSRQRNFSWRGWCRRGSCSRLVVTKLPHYVLPLYPAIAILTAGAVELRVLSRRIFLVRGIIWWFLVPGIVSILAIVGAVMIGHSLALLAWPFFAGAVVCGLFAWRLYDDDGAERAYLRAAGAAVLMAFGVYGVVVPSLSPAGFPAVALAQVLKDAPCQHPLAASAGYEEPSLVFLTSTAIRFTDAEGAADFLRQGSCRFAFIEMKQERAFALRAEAIGLHYDRGARVVRLQHIGRQAGQYRGFCLGGRAVSADVPAAARQKRAGGSRKHR